MRSSCRTDAALGLVIATLAFARSLLSQTPPTDSSAAYHALLARFQAHDTTVDVTALRLAYAHSPAYSPYGSDADAVRDSMNAALHRHDYARAVQLGDSALAIDFLDVRTHVMKAYASDQLGDTTTAWWDRRIAALIVRSILWSGAGTVDSPYVVVSVAEEYGVIGMTGYRPGSQSLGQCGQHPCDVMEVTKGADGPKRTFYFDISLPKAYLERVLGEKN